LKMYANWGRKINCPQIKHLSYLERGISICLKCPIVVWMCVLVGIHVQKSVELLQMALSTVQKYNHNMHDILSESLGVRQSVSVYSDGGKAEAILISNFLIF